MKESSLAKFITTALLPEHYPRVMNQSGTILPEVAVAGRSNVGKSSLLNDLFNSTNLVKTSSTPGKTQALNFFNYQDRISFVDLPGYGYAAVPLKIRKEWGPMIQTYLQKRTELRLILLLLDIRRTPSDEDLQFIDWVAHYEKALIVVFTKVDKLTSKEKEKQTQLILSTIPAANIHYIHYSVPKRLGKKELLRLIEEALTDEMNPKTSL